MIALIVAAIMDSDHNPTGMDAPYPHYWIYHLYLIPLAFAAIGLVGTFVFNAWLAGRVRQAFVLFALVSSALIVELVLEARFVVIAGWLDGISALWILVPFYVLLLCLLKVASNQTIRSEPRQSNSA